MSGSTYFAQECPTCGRGLRIRIQYLGKEVACQHCRSQFVSCEPGSDSYAASQSGLTLLRRADELLATASAVRSRPR